MNTRQLRHLLAVVEHGSVSAAADHVNLSQPALSRSLRALEDELRAPLFDRHERRLVPTPFAQAYLARARRIVFEEAEGARELALMHSGRAGSLAFGMGSALARSLLGRLLIELMAAAPGLKLRTLIDTADRLLDALRKEELDFFVGDVRVADTDERVSGRAAARLPLRLVRAPGSPAAGTGGAGHPEGAALPARRAGFHRAGRAAAVHAPLRADRLDARPLHAAVR